MTEESITQLLVAWRSGDDDRAAERLFPLVYGQMRRMARGQLRGRRPGQTLSSQTLVHEAYLKLERAEALDLRDRSHFFAVAARAMRQIAVDHARRRVRHKRGGGAEPAPVDEVQLADPQLGPEELVQLDEALGQLRSLDARLCSVVELRYFAGLEVEEVATALDISSATVKRDWRKARAFLFDALRPGDFDGSGTS